MKAIGLYYMSASKDKRADFIKFAKKIHGDKYSYDKVVYVNIDTKVELGCPHGTFWVSPYEHTKAKSGCRRCKTEDKEYAEKVRSFIVVKKPKMNGLKLAKDKLRELFGYRFSIVEFNGRNKTSKLKCKEHGEFECRLGNAYISKWASCPGCEKEFFYERFKKKSKERHGDKFAFDKESYIEDTKNVKIYCKKHGWFRCNSTEHLNEKSGRCPECIFDIGRVPKAERVEYFESEIKKKLGPSYGYDRLKYVTSHVPVEIKCPRHGYVTLLPTNIIYNNSKCKACAHYGGARVYLYLMKVGKKLKTGLSRDVNNRKRVLKSYTGQNIEIIKKWKIDLGLNPFEVELEVRNNLMGLGAVYNEKSEYRGYSEVFTVAAKEEDVIKTINKSFVW